MLVKHYSISVVIPFYNESEVIIDTYKRLSKIFLDLESQNYQLIFVDDGSNDDSVNQLKQSTKKDKRVQILELSRNFGHQNALTAGLHQADSDFTLIIDADCQDPPELLEDMVKVAIENDANIVYGVRKKRKDSAIKRLPAYLFYRLLNFLAGVKIPLDTGDFRLVDRKALVSFKQCPEKNKYIRGLFAWMGFKQVPFYYNRDARQAGETKYTWRKMFHLAYVGIFYFSKIPLKLATFFGFLCFFIGLFFAVIITIQKVITPDHIVAGWTSTIIAVIFFGGVQLITIGVLGEYISSIFDEVKRRPNYIIKNKSHPD